MGIMAAYEGTNNQSVFPSRGGNKNFKFKHVMVLHGGTADDLSLSRIFIDKWQLSVMEGMGILYILKREFNASENKTILQIESNMLIRIK